MLRRNTFAAAVHSAAALYFAYVTKYCITALSFYHQQHNHMCRIVNIEEPAVQILVSDIAALSVI